MASFVLAAAVADLWARRWSYSSIFGVDFGPGQIVRIAVT